MYNYKNLVCNKIVQILVMLIVNVKYIIMKPVENLIVSRINICIIQGSLYMASIVAAYFFCTK